MDARSQVGSRAEPPAAKAEGDQHNVEQLYGGGARLSQQWSGACLSYAPESGALHPLGLLISVLAPLLASGAFSQEPICRWSRSGDMAVPVTCADMLFVSSVT